MKDAAGAARHPLKGQCLAAGRTADLTASTGRYGRLFPDLPPLDVEPALLHALGRQGSACDAGDADALADTVAAGWPFFGQLVAHDITADRSPLDHASGAALRNFRSPRLDLECLYGAGPVGSPYLYDRDDGAKLLEGDGDLPRNAQGTALIGDPRNDVHLFVNRLHLALIRAHNAIVDHLREGGLAEAELFDEARTTLMRHYQWVVLHDFLAGLVGPERLHAALRAAPENRLVREPTIPFEFADAAYRYGHSQIRQSYRIAEGAPPLPIFPDLLGFRPVPADLDIDWPLVFDIPGHAPAERAAKIDARMPRALLDLPVEITGHVMNPDYASLAARDLQRGQATALPSGEAVARALGEPPLTPGEIALTGWSGETPLWFYIQREAAVREAGERLGPVGGRIVADVFVAILDGDPASIRHAPNWVPVLPAAAGAAETFGLADLLTLPDRLGTAG